MNGITWLRQAQKLIDLLDAELLLKAVGGFCNRAELVLREQDELSGEQLAQLDALMGRRKSGEPLAYILGAKEFYGREFAVTPEVLIPRPETEVMVDLAKGLRPQPRRILEVGTGSGAVAVSLALELGEVEVLGVDISEQALEIARRNAERLGAQVEFVQSDLLLAVPEQWRKVDLVVANLPYVDKSWDWVSAGLAYEPELALYAEQGGLATIYRLIDQLAEAKIQTKWLILEADPCQHAAIIDYVEQKGWSIEKQQDFQLLISDLC